MKYFVILLLSWYFQDLAQIMMTQTFLAPELYALTLASCATSEETPQSPFRWIAAAVIGGLFFDLRWIGIPGLSSAIYLALIFAVRRMWYQVPAPNRRMLPFTMITGGTLVLITPLRLIFWDFSILSGRIFVIVAAQWALSGAALLIAAILRPYYYDEL